MAHAVFPLAPKPASLLGFHRVLSPSAGVRVSPLCLGAMNFGDTWKDYLGECNQTTAFEMLDFFYDNGGNFIDTANNYQGEESESWIGEWMAARGNRDQLVIATKFTTCYRRITALGPSEKLLSNYQGNHSKSLKVSVAASLKKLKTEYIDLLYVHWWDYTTSIPELMNSLHHLVASGQVLHLGISDTPAWLVVKANEYARHHGLTPFSVYQGFWNAANRDFERDIIPMCRSEGLALAPWGALGRGQFRPAEEYNEANREGRNSGPQSEAVIAVGKKLAQIAQSHGPDVPVTSIALAYVMHKTPYVFPIVGGRKVEHLRSNIAALGIRLSEEEMKEIEAAAPFDVGFPSSFIFGADWHLQSHVQNAWVVQNAAWLEAVPFAKPIVPGSGLEIYEKRTASQS